MEYHDHRVTFVFYEPFLSHTLAVTEHKYMLYFMQATLGMTEKGITTKYSTITTEERRELYLSIL